MAFIGRLHPLLIHFPIALVVVAALAEFVAMVTADERWRTVAVANLRAGAGFALLAAVAGWRLALAPDMEASPLLEWHRWLGTMGTGAAAENECDSTSCALSSPAGGSAGNCPAPVSASPNVLTQ